MRINEIGTAHNISGCRITCHNYTLARYFGVQCSFGRGEERKRQFGFGIERSSAVWHLHNDDDNILTGQLRSLDGVISIARPSERSLAHRPQPYPPVACRYQFLNSNIT